MNIIDTHTHLYDIEDPLAVLRMADAAGVTDVVALGVDLASNEKHRHLCQRLRDMPGAAVPRVHLALGLHPGNITTMDDAGACFAFMREHMPEAVAIGETGLDFFYKRVRKDEAKKQEQRVVFQRHLDMAAEFDLPIVIHSRGAWRDAFERTRKAGITKALFHWYSGPIDVLKDILDTGYFVSVSPALEYSPESQRTAAYVPLDRLLVETDTPVAVSAPDGTRVPSTPADVWRTFRALCAIRKIDAAEALPALNHNARVFFNLAVI
jgi:TatD DNase family protein